MSNLYVDRKGIEIRADGEALAFYDGVARIGTVPMAPLSRVFLRGDVKLSASLLGKLGEHNIGVVILSGRKGKVSLLMGRPHNDARLRLAQYRASQNDAICLALSHWIVESKIRAQQQLLRHYLEQRAVYRYEISLQLRHLDEILKERLPRTSQIQSLRGIEGAAAQAYFQALRSIFPDSAGFEGRNRRPPKDPANALLSLGYTLLHNEAVLALHAAGFDPYIGFFHTLDFGRESLACDIIEPLRTLIDQFTIQLLAKQTIKAEHFSQHNKGCLLGKAGRQHFYQAYNQLHESVISQLTQNIADLKKRLSDASHDPAFQCDEEESHERLSDLL